MANGTYRRQNEYQTKSDSPRKGLGVKRINPNVFKVFVTEE